MGSLIEILFNNPILIFLLIFGLSSYFKRKQAKSTPADEEVSDPSKDRSLVRDLMKKIEDFSNTLEETMDTSKEKMSQEGKLSQKSQSEQALADSNVSSSSAEIQRQAQFERLKAQYEANSHPDLTNRAEKEALAMVERSPIYEGDLRLDLSSRLNRRSLMESVMMAEILGPPRSKKRHPYR